MNSGQHNNLQEFETESMNPLIQSARNYFSRLGWGYGSHFCPSFSLVF